VKNLRNALAWTVAAMMLGLFVQPANAQERHGERDRDRVRARAPRALVSTFGAWNDDRARLGVYIDVHQPTRYDERGARLTGVKSDSPADEAGLEEGDIITRFDGRSLTQALPDADREDELDPDESMPAQRLLALAEELEEGDVVELEYIRDGQSYSADVTAAEVRGPREFLYSWSDAEPRIELQGLLQDRVRDVREYADEARVLAEGARELAVLTSRGDFVFGAGVDACPSGGRLWLSGDGGCLVGAEVREISPELGEYFEADAGVLVLDVTGDNPMGLIPGDVIVQIGDRETYSINRARRLLRSYEEDETVRVTVIRKGERVVLEGTLER
jgi:PDZ domain-containing protein